MNTGNGLWPRQAEYRVATALHSFIRVGSRRESPSVTGDHKPPAPAGQELLKIAPVVARQEQSVGLPPSQLGE
jgi:hypothetical protein